MTALADLLAAIDADNADDPNTFDGRPLAQAQGQMADGWVTHLDPNAADALRVAARAHHLRRWALLRSDYPEGRDGYLRWRRDQKKAHAERLGTILAGADPALIERAAAIVQKKGLGSDPEVQVFEDAVCLTFIETQFLDTADKLGDDEKMVDVVAKTLRKMSAAGHGAAATIALDDRSADLLRRAVDQAGE
ncbi:MAG: hypothetical protein DHS20C19_19830 [Acidimicrobiales bacterium]|nr:MAG: hypothetical protein DHS20C19_19830 [Acidimicrobiales bacterium]